MFHVSDWYPDLAAQDRQGIKNRLWSYMLTLQSNSVYHDLNLGDKLDGHQGQPILQSCIRGHRGGLPLPLISRTHSRVTALLSMQYRRKRVMYT